MILKVWKGCPPDFPILCNWAFDNFIFADEFFAKYLLSFETCVLVNNNLCGKSVIKTTNHIWKRTVESYLSTILYS